MSDDGGRSAVGPFLLGLALGAALGALFAPESGAKVRARLGKRAGRLREDLGDVIDEIRTVVAAGGGESDAPATPRDALQQRLTAARAARRAPALTQGAGDTPLA